MKQTDEAKLERSREILEALKEARGGKLLDSHRVMGNDIYVRGNVKETIPRHKEIDERLAKAILKRNGLL